MQGSYFIPKEKLAEFMREGAMNNQEGLYLFGLVGPEVKRLLPPPLELTDPASPMFYLYAVNIREPTFAPWYMEGGIGVMAKYRGQAGLYFLSIQLSGPGALMGAYTGREGSGLPKKLCDRIVVERTDSWGHCFIERDGVKLVEVNLEIGRYNNPAFHQEQENCQAVKGGMSTDGGCLLHKYRVGNDGAFREMEIIYYDSPTRYHSWEPASAEIRLASTINDPWAEVGPVTVLGAGWSKCDNWVRSMSRIHSYSEAEGAEAMQYLYTGRYDRCLLCRAHQHYE